MTEPVATTYLETRSPPVGAPRPCPVAGAVIAREVLAADEYLKLYVAVGGPLGWDGHLELPRQDLAALLASAATAIYVLRLADDAVGFCEFLGDLAPDVELKYFGLIPSVHGRGLGPWLLDAALRDYWATATPSRLWLHTDTWDDPKAVTLYANIGFREFAKFDLPANATHKDYRVAIGLGT